MTIVETDLLFDANLAADLAAAGLFDLVTVWLMGAHEAREYCTDVMALANMTSAKYRIYVQNAAYELADKVLAVGGHLQIVDRLHSADDGAMRQELALSHVEQAEPTTLEVIAIEFREYREAEAGGIKMLLKNNGQERRSILGCECSYRPSYRSSGSLRMLVLTLHAIGMICWRAT